MITYLVSLLVSLGLTKDAPSAKGQSVPPSQTSPGGGGGGNGKGKGKARDVEAAEVGGVGGADAMDIDVGVTGGNAAKEEGEGAALDKVSPLPPKSVPLSPPSSSGTATATVTVTVTATTTATTPSCGAGGRGAPPMGSNVHEYRDIHSMTAQSMLR